MKCTAYSVKPYSLYNKAYSFYKKPYSFYNKVYSFYKNAYSLYKKPYSFYKSVPNGIYRPQKTRAYPHEWIRSRSIYQIENTIVAINGSKTYT